MFPEWVEKYRAAGTTIKKIGNNYYLYHATSRYVQGKSYPVSQQTYIGKITPEGVVSERVSINPQKTEACRLGTLVENLDSSLGDLIVLKIKGSWYYTKLDRNTVSKLKEMKLYDNGKVVFSDI